MPAQKLHIRWVQKSWNRNKCCHWLGHRADGRSFEIVYMLGKYTVRTFNGTHLGKADTLADAQKIAQNHPGPTIMPRGELVKDSKGL